MVLKRKRILWLSLMLATVLLFTACAGSGLKNELNWEVKNFSAIDQDGETVTLDDLKGDVWLTSFIFTHCVTVCPPMTANMAELQQELLAEDIDVPIISFSVDPERDTPDVLTAYGEQFEADFSTWKFLTGYTFEDIQQLSEESFKALVEWEPDSDQVMHGTSFYLVNQSGVVVKSYSGLEPPYEEILSDIKKIR